MSEPTIKPTGFAPARRTYCFSLTGAETMTDRWGNQFQPKALEIEITPNSLRAAVNGKHIKKDGSVGQVDRYVSWYARQDAERGNYLQSDIDIPPWLALELQRCQMSRPIYGPNWPEAWAEVLP